jgi:hypothetical protein
LVKHPEKIKEFRDKDTQRRESELLSEVQSKAQVINQGEDRQEQMKNIMEGETELTEELYEKMMGEWMQGANAQEHMA